MAPGLRLDFPGKSQQTVAKHSYGKKISSKTSGSGSQYRFTVLVLNTARGVGGRIMWVRILHAYLNSLIRHGTLLLTYPHGGTRHYGERDSSARVAVVLHDQYTVRRLATNPEMALGECYTDGGLSVENDDLRAFASLVVRNLASPQGQRLRRPYRAIRWSLRFLRQYNPIRRARENVAHHYDLSCHFYRLFLDDDLQYSCAYFHSPDASLEQAQADKKAHIARKLLLGQGNRVLDIGCGWGGMGLTLARDYAARVTGVTLSTEQQLAASQRAREEGLDDRARFRLQDYRHVEGQFDRIVSVGMFEHVGVPHYDEYFRNIRDRLDEAGVALIHTIGRCTPPGISNPWIARYIFPGGYIPAMSEVLTSIERSGLVVTDVEVLRYHYADTLHHWHRRFMMNIDTVREIYSERFCRMWRFYLAISEAAFRGGDLVVFQFQLGRRGSAVPVTRDYLYATAGEKAEAHVPCQERGPDPEGQAEQPGSSESHQVI